MDIYSNFIEGIINTDLKPAFKVSVIQHKISCQSYKVHFLSDDMTRYLNILKGNDVIWIGCFRRQ